MNSRKTLLTLVIATLATGCAATVALGQTRNYRFDISGESLSQALRNYGQISGQEIIFTEDVVAGVMPDALQGEYTAEIALEHLLKGTGLTAERSPSGALMIRKPHAQQFAGRQISYVDRVDAPAVVRLSQSGTASSPSQDGQRVGDSSGNGNNNPASSAGETGSRLEEIIVTSQKREEKLQDVPVSVQVIGGATLQQQNYNSLDTALKTVPGVATNDSSGQANTIFIRGIGSGNNESLDQSVATFYDDIFHGRSRMSGAIFLDLDRIEVLKGPQSTFFGNNAIAGALNIVSKKPGDAFDGWGRILYGQFGQYAAEGAVGGPITDTFGVRVAVTRGGGSGWTKNVTLNEHIPRVNDEAARVTLEFKPVQDFDATLKIEGSQLRVVGSSFGEANQAGNCPPPAPFAPSDIIFCPQLLALRSAGVQVPSGLDNNLTSGIAGPGNWLSTAESALTVNYDHWGHTFTSVTGFYNYHYNAQFSAPEPESIFNSTAPERYSQLSQELRVASPTGGTIEYLAGAYFQTDKLFYGSNLNLPYLGAVVPGEYLGTHADDTQSEHSYAIFGSATWNVSDNLKLSGGLRGSWDSKSYAANSFTGLTSMNFQGIVPQPAFFGPPISLNGNGTWHDWMPSAKIQYQLSAQAMGYLSFSQGWKAGGFNGVNPTDNPADVPYGPEHVNAYELGLKSKWLEDTVLLDVAVFRSNYNGLQSIVEVINTECPGGCNFIRNAASSVTQGVEVETRWVVSRDFQLSANVSYIDAYYVNYLNGTPTSLAVLRQQPFEDLSGARIPGTPRWSGSINATYSTRVPGNYKFITQVLPYLSSSYYQDDLGQFRGAYTRLDARVALESPDGHWGLDLIGKNLTDRIISLPPEINIVQVVKEEPRNVAVQVRYKF